MSCSITFNVLLNWVRRHKTPVAIFFAGFLVHLVYTVAVQIVFGSHAFISHSDAFSFYLRGAENLVNRGIFSLNINAPFMPDAYRTPLYTLMVAAVLWLKLPIITLIIFQNFLAGIMGVLVYKIGLHLFASHRIAMFAALATVFEPLTFHWNSLLMSDYVFAVFFVAACYAFFVKQHYLFGLLMGLATLTRPLSLYFLPVFFLAAIIISYREHKNLSYVPWRKFIISALIFAAVLFPWMWRNKSVFNTWQLTSAFWYNMYGIVLRHFALENNIALPELSVPADYPNPQNFIYDFANVPFYKKTFYDIALAHPYDYVKYHLWLSAKSLFVNYYDNFITYVLKAKLPALLAGVWGIVASAISNLLWFGWVIVYVFMAISIFDRCNRVWLSVFAAIISFIALTHGVSGLYGLDISRFLMPVAPFMFLFAGAGARVVLQKMEPRK